MLTHRSHISRHGQWSLVGLLVALAIILILAALYVPHIAARHSHRGEAPTPIERAHGVGCSYYVEQMNQAAMMYKDSHGTPPRSLDDLKSEGITDDMINAEGCYYQISDGVVTDAGNGRGAAPALGAAPATATTPAPPNPNAPMILQRPGAAPAGQPGTARPGPAAGNPQGGSSSVYGIRIPSSGSTASPSDTGSSDTGSDSGN